MPQGDMNDLVNRALGGPAIDESLLMAEMYPVLEEQMQAQFDSDLENLSIQDDTEYLNLVVETIAQSNPAVRDVTVERAEAAEQNFNEFRAYLERFNEFPEAAEVDEDVALGSYYVRKKPPFFFSMNMEVTAAMPPTEAAPIQNQDICNVSQKAVEKEERVM